MRRRTFLAVTGATALLPAVVACRQSRSGSSATPVPTMPPKSDAVPTAFADASTWPAADTYTTITAVRDHYLCGGARIKDALNVFTEGWCPVVVDISTLTTYAVLLDQKGAWVTRKVDLVDDDDLDQDPKGALTTIFMGSTLLDGEHAYLAFGALALSSPSTQDSIRGSDFPKGTACPVILVKIRLSDGSIQAATTVADSYLVEGIEELHLSFANDRSSLVIMGDDISMDNSQESENDYIALRLSVTDLSVQLDAHSILDGHDINNIRLCGQAIAYYVKRAADGVGDYAIMFLSDNKRERTGEQYPIVVRDDWYYYKDNQDRESSSGSARNIVSGETIALNGNWKDEVQVWPSISSDQQVYISWNDQNSSRSMSIRAPGAAAGALTWDGENHKVPDGACVVGDVLYSFYRVKTSSSASSSEFDITSISSGETIADVQKTAITYGTNNAVTPWGLVADGRFYAATKWFDDVSFSTSTASPPAASSTPTT